jgi:lipopolysaccharide/colanic/teichoic acid biosynthesis glycosyltransferase
MTFLVGRSFGFVAVLVFAPVMAFLALALKLSGARSILREQLWLAESRHVRTKRFVTPANAFGDFLRDNHLDHLPALLDVAAGRVRLLVNCEDRLGVRIALAPEAVLDRTPAAEAGIAARHE